MNRAGRWLQKLFQLINLAFYSIARGFILRNLVQQLAFQFIIFGRQFVGDELCQGVVIVSQMQGRSLRAEDKAQKQLEAFALFLFQFGGAVFEAVDPFNFYGVYVSVFDFAPASAGQPAQ